MSPRETQLFRVEVRPHAGRQVRIHLNDQPVGPPIDSTLGEPVMNWFLGYLEQRVAGTLERLRLPGGGIIRREHDVPDARCPSCGKGGPTGPIVGVLEDPCPVCRR